MYWLVDLVVEDGGLVVFGGLFVDRIRFYVKASRTDPLALRRR